MITPTLHFLQNLQSSFTSWTWSKTGQEKYDYAQFFFTLFVTFALFWYAWLFLKPKNLSSSPLPQGPKGLPLLGNLLGLDTELHTNFTRLSQTYGPILKLQLGSKVGIVISSSSLPRQVLKDHEVTFSNHEVTTASRILSYGGCDIVCTPYGPEWRMLRKVCGMKMLNKTTMDSVYVLRRQEVRQTVSYMYRKVGSPVNVGDQIFLTTLNVITNMIWGGTVEGDERARLGVEFREVVSEIMEMLGKPNVSDFYPGLARFDMQGQAKQMEGLVRRLDGIYERMIGQRRRIAEEGGEKSNVGGYTIPKGSCVFINAWAIHRDPNKWEEALKFNPERFLNSKWDYRGSDFNYLPFGSGGRICPGIGMAERMIMYSLATFLHSFEWEVPPEEKLDLLKSLGLF